MPSFQDSAVIFFLALLLFGPKKLPELARYVGKLMGEFRRASAEFRLQMEDEFRQSEQAEQQKKIAAIEAAAPASPPLNIPEPEHPHLPPPMTAEQIAEVSEQPLAHENTAAESPSAESTSALSAPAEIPEYHIDARPAATPVPIATAGDLQMLPPSTGLPVGRFASEGSIGAMFASVPKAAAPAAQNGLERSPEPAAPEAHTNA